MRGRTCLAATILVAGIGFFAERASAFDAAAYRAYLERTREMTAAELIESRRPYPYRLDVPPPAAPPEYLEPIAARLHLTAGERQLLDQHGFVVSERLAYPSFEDAFRAIWHAD